MSPTTDYVAWKFWLDVLQLLGIAAIGLYSWWTNSSKANKKRFSGLETRVVKVEAATNALHGEMKKRPPCLHHDEFDHRLRGVQEGVSNIEGRMVGVGNSLDLIQSHLITNGGKG